MTTDRLQRRIDQMLDEAEQALVALDWKTVLFQQGFNVAAGHEFGDEVGGALSPLSLNGRG